MQYTTKINVRGDEFVVVWEGYADVLIPENKSIFDSHIIDCPPDMLKKYGQAIILYECNAVEEDLAEERKTERKLNNATD